MGDRPLPPALLRPQHLRGGRSPLHIAAVGDLHVDADAPRSRLVGPALAAGARSAHLLLLAGDLTAAGTPQQARVVADACRSLTVPVVAVLGNHDHDTGRGAEVAAVLTDAGVVVLRQESVEVSAGGVRVGVVGLTGRPDPGRRQARTDAAQAAAMDAGLGAVADCSVRLVLLHFSPTHSTLVGEREELWPRLCCAALADPIAAHRPDLVVHAHAHAGVFRGAVDGVPVFNVSREVLRRDLCVLEVIPRGEGERARGAPLA